MPPKESLALGIKLLYLATPDLRKLLAVGQHKVSLKYQKFESPGVHKFVKHFGAPCIKGIIEMSLVVLNHHMHFIPSDNLTN